MSYYNYVYILANTTRTVLYIGVTNNLERRLAEHKAHSDPNSFSAHYNATDLVYYEVTTDIEAAIAREKQIKSWNRKRKNKLVASRNPHWKTLTLE